MEATDFSPNGFTIFAKATLAHWLALAPNRRPYTMAGEWAGIAGFPKRSQCQAWIDANASAYKEFDRWEIAENGRRGSDQDD